MMLLNPHKKIREIEEHLDLLESLPERKYKDRQGVLAQTIKYWRQRLDYYRCEVNNSD